MPRALYSSAKKPPSLSGSLSDKRESAPAYYLNGAAFTASHHFSSAY